MVTKECGHNDRVVPLAVRERLVRFQFFRRPEPAQAARFAVNLACLGAVRAPGLDLHLRSVNSSRLLVLPLALGFLLGLRANLHAGVQPGVLPWRQTRVRSQRRRRRCTGTSWGCPRRSCRRLCRPRRGRSRSPSASSPGAIRRQTGSHPAILFSGEARGGHGANSDQGNQVSVHNAAGLSDW